MPNWAYAVLLALLVPLLGIMLAGAFLARGSRWNLPLAFASLALGVFVTGWIALVLAEFGRFDRWSLLGILAVVAILAGGWHWRMRAAGPSSALLVPTNGDHFAPWEWLMLAVWLAAALWLFFRPHEYVLGGADAGVYVSLGAEIARQGGFQIVDETFAGLDPSIKAAVVRPLPNTPGAASYLFPGFYVTNEAEGHLTPQFYPLHPVMQAVAFSATSGGEAGIRAELLLTGMWMALGTLAVYLAARDISGPFVAALVLGGLSLSALQVWFGRYPTSEAMTQFFLWVGIWSAARWLADRPPPALWAFVAGCAFGAVFLVRIDSLVMLPVLTVLLIWRWTLGWKRADSWFAAPLVLLIMHSILHGHFQSAPYFYETVGYGIFLLARLWPVFVSAVIAGVALLWWMARRAPSLQSLPRMMRPILGLLVGLWLAYALYGWFLRPELNTVTLRPDVFSGGELPVTNHENWPRLGWYLSPPGVWLGVLGTALLLWRADRRTGIVLAFGLLFSALYLWNVSANPHHVYVMRRYVPVVVPFFILGGAYLLGKDWAGLVGRHRFLSGSSLMSHMPGFLAIAVMAAFWLGSLAWAARGFISQVDNAGLTRQLDDLAGRLPEGAVVLFNDQSPVGQGDVWGTPLRFVYGFDAFTLRQPPAAITGPLVETVKSWQNMGRTVVWVGDTEWLDRTGLRFTSESATVISSRLESSYDRKPQATVPHHMVLTLNYLESNGDE